MYNLREGLARISASPGTSSEPHTKRRVLFCFFFLPSPVLRAPGRVGQHRLLRKLVLRRVGDFGGSASEREGGEFIGRGGVALPGTRGRSRALETARRVTGASSPSGEFGRVRERAGGSRRARRKAEGCRAARFSRSARGRASRVRTVLCILSLAQYPCVLVGWFQFFFLWTTDATKQARESQRRRRTARRASRDRGRRKEASEAERLPTARSRSGDGFRRTHTSSHFAVVSTMCASKSACRFAGSSILLARNRVSHPMVSRTGRTARALGMPAKVTDESENPSSPCPHRVSGENFARPVMPVARA